MIKVIVFIAACLFTLYGMWQMTRAMQRSIEKERLCEHKSEEEINKGGTTSSYFLLAKNCDYNIEWLIHNFYAFHTDSGATQAGLTVIDLDSDDDTRRILELLAKRYDDLHLMTAEEFALFLKSYIEKV